MTIRKQPSCEGNQIGRNSERIMAQFPSKLRTNALDGFRARMSCGVELELGSVRKGELVMLSNLLKDSAESI